MENEDADSLDASSSKVLEYYTKYSRDKKLATYFCGDITINEFEQSQKDVFSLMENLPGVVVTDVTDCEGERVIVEECFNKSRPPLIGQDKYDNVGLEDSENEIVRASSPSSSVASNRKLEWDSGADIGYENCQKQKFLHKSLSLPTLTSSDKIDLNKSILRLSPEGKVTESGTQTQQKESSSESSDAQFKPSEIPITSSSSDGGQNPAQVIQSSSSSSYASKPQDIVSSTESECDSEVKNNVLEFLHKKVGLPVAASTPVYKLKEINFAIFPPISVLQKVESKSDSGQECVGSPSTNSNSNLTHSSGKTLASVLSVVDNLKQIDNGFDVISSYIPDGNGKKPNHSDLLNERRTYSLAYRNKKIKQLCITTPWVIECLESRVYSKKALDKVIQTTPVSFISIGVQTEAENKSTFEDFCLKNCQVDRQSVIYFHHSDSDKEPSSRTLGTNTLSNATDQDISNCNSFEYVYGDQHEVSSKKDVSTLNVHQIPPPDDIVRINAGANNLKRSQARFDLNVVSPSDLNRMSPSSHTGPLGELIAQEQSKNSEVDVSKNIDLIKKLIKSKKYDKITKQYYIKKIVQTILSSNENSDISVNSDVTDVEKNKQVSSVKNKPEEFAERPCRNLQENLPWVPAHLHSKQLEIRTFSTEILPETAFTRNEETKFHSRVKKNSVFTLPSNSKYYKIQSSSDRSSTNEVNPNFQQPEPAQLSTGTSEQGSDYINKNGFQNWKEAKTLSEQRFEHQQTLESGKKDCGDVESISHSESDGLLNFAKKEREHQINWINNEIVHLSKLKHMLQKKDYKMNVDILTKPEISDMKNIKKSTSVYVITTEKRGSPRKGRKLIEQPLFSNESTSSRKEAVNVKVASHKHEPIWYKNGERYGKKLASSSMYPQTECKCAKCKASNQSCACATTSQLRKSSPQRTNEKEVPPLRLCKCIDNQICTDETCLYSTRKSPPERMKEVSRKAPTTCKCSESKLKDEICFDETCPHLSPTRTRKALPEGYLQKELCKENGNDEEGITHLTLNSELNQAKLISSELYSNGVPPYACIRRYVFEIPLSSGALDKNTPKEGKLRPAKDELAAAQRVMIEEKMGFPEKRSTAINEFVESDALKEIPVSQSKYLTEKGIADRKLENIPRSSGSYEAYRDDTARDLYIQSTQRSNAVSQTSILDVRRSDSENLRKRTKQKSVSYESSTEISVNEYPNVHHRHTQKDDMRSVNLQKTDVGDKRIETDKVKTTTSTRSKDKEDEVKYSAGTSEYEYDDGNLEDQKRTRSEYGGSKLEDEKRRMRSEKNYAKWEDQKARIRSEYEDDISEDRERGINRRTLNEDDKWDDQKRRIEYKYSEYQKGIESEHEDDQKGRGKRPEYKSSKLDGHKRTELEYEDSRWEDQGRGVRLEYEYGKSDDHKRMIDSEGDDSQSKDQRRRTKSDYKDSKSEDQKRRIGLEHKGTMSEDQKRTQEKDRETSPKYNIEYRSRKPLRLMRGKNDEDTEESEKGKITKRVTKVDAETDDDYLQKKNKKITARGEKQSSNKLTQTTLTRTDKKRDLTDSSSSTSSSSQTESSSSDSSRVSLCPCCKKNKSRATALMTNLQRDIQPLLCQPCFTQNQQNNWPNNYRYPGHVCNCYTVLKTETVQQIKKTVDELGDLEREQQFCSCSYAGKNRNIKYCSYCDCKKKDGRRKAVAYMLTFEQGSNESDEENRRRCSLEEVKVKIPYPHRKKNKDNENKKRKAKKDDPNHKRHRHRSHKKHKHRRILTLQEYLSLNRPNFIENAEQRRKSMVELAYMREQRCDKYKQLLALSSGLPPPKNDGNDLKSKRIFSSKKMKEITAQNYKKLPEVQKKLKDNRDRQIKKANRLLADIFNKKLRENVLKGRHTLSTSTSVIKLV